MDADMAVCDLSARNPNVLYELGLRHATKKPETLIKDLKTDDVFDVKNIRRLEYDTSLRIDKIHGTIDQLAESIKSTYDSRHDATNSLMSLLDSTTSASAQATGNASSSYKPTQSESIPFISGKLTHWEDDRKRGVAASDGVSYYVNPRFMVGAPTIKIGGEVYFVPLSPPSEGANPTASVLIFDGQMVTGIVRYVNTLRNFAFVAITDGYNNTSSIYLQIPADEPHDIAEGRSVQFIISRNSQGVCGSDPVVID